MVRVSISKMNNGRAAGLPDILSEMVKAGRERGVDLITDLQGNIALL